MSRWVRLSLARAKRNWASLWSFLSKFVSSSALQFCTVVSTVFFKLLHPEKWRLGAVSPFSRSFGAMYRNCLASALHRISPTLCLMGVKQLYKRLVPSLTRYSPLAGCASDRVPNCIGYISLLSCSVKTGIRGELSIKWLTLQRRYGNWHIFRQDGRVWMALCSGVG